MTLLKAWRRSTPNNKELVYGVYGDELVLIPMHRAQHLALTWKAMVTAKTWGALRRLAPPKAYREILAFQESPRSIRAAHPFDYGEMAVVCDGDYPGFPKREVMDWMPRAVWEQWGQMVWTVNGEYPGFDPADTRKIVASLKQCGFRCRRRQRLIEAAH